MITVEFTEEITRIIDVEPGYYKDFSFQYYLNSDGELLCITPSVVIVYDHKSAGREKKIAELASCDPSTRDEFYAVYESARQIRSSILSK